MLMPASASLAFDDVVIDVAGHRLLRGGVEQPLEPKAFAVLVLLAGAPGQVFGRDQILDAVWGHHHVTPGVLNRIVVLLRQALGEDGQQPRLLHTVFGVGYRFDLPASTIRVGAETAAGILPMAAGARADTRPSLAVLPFRVVGHDARHAALGGAFADELITELSRLRWLFVTARGSSFRFDPASTDFTEVGRLLGVRYCLRGTLELAGRKAIITVDLVETGTSGVIWGERFTSDLAELHALREVLRTRVLAELDLRIPMREADLAQGPLPEDLDAWAAFHLGLRHVYRFNSGGCNVALGWFQRAVALDPNFARAHAGLSFVHFLNAFVHYNDDVAGETLLARRAAECAVDLDPLDPFVNFTMGRTYWLEGDMARSLGWLQRATDLCPNYAQGIYARAFSEVMSGHPMAARAHTDLAMRLSPLDPLHYAMQSARAFSHIAVGEDAAAAEWAGHAARAPGAHELIAMIAAAASALEGDRAAAMAWAANARMRNAALTCADFFRAFPIHMADMRKRVGTALAGVGF
jgi:TolB-like protein